MRALQRAAIAQAYNRSAWVRLAMVAGMLAVNFLGIAALASVAVAPAFDFALMIAWLVALAGGFAWLTVP